MSRVFSVSNAFVCSSVGVLPVGFCVFPQHLIQRPGDVGVPLHEALVYVGCAEERS